MHEFLIGVDGGGSGTRVALADRHAHVLARAEAGPSGLALGIDAAWQQIGAAVAAAAALAGVHAPPSACALCAGLAGASHLPWRQAFVAANPGYARVRVESDGELALIAAHGSGPGLLLIAGTGSVGEARQPDGQRQSAGGWGFPSGDEGSGAWLGLGAVQIAQQALDGRAPAGVLARRVWALCGAERLALQSWCSAADQGGYAQLAPEVFAAAAQDPAAAALLHRAAAALAGLAAALDPDARLPLALAGSVARALRPWLAPGLAARCVEPRHSAVDAALLLIQTAAASPAGATP